jgi:hypothetical protein
MTSHGYEVTPVNLPQDKPDLLALWANNLQVQRANERFAWLYEGTHSAQSWVLRTTGGSLVGAAALGQRMFQVHGARARGAQAIDFVIDKRHRTLGPAIQLQDVVTRSLESNGLALAYALPNRKSEAVLIRSGYQRTGSLHRWSRVLRFEPYISQWIQNKFLSRVAARGLSAIDRVAAPDIWHGLGGAWLEERSDFDGRFDDLWKKAAGQFEVVGERTSEYLNWRFCQHPTARYGMTTLMSHDDGLLGYVVHYIEGDVLRIADTLAADMKSWKVMMAAFVRKARGLPVSAINILHFGSPAFEGLLQSLGFRRRGCDTSVLVHVAGRRESLPSSISWHLTEADRDV